MKKSALWVVLLCVSYSADAADRSVPSVEEAASRAALQDVLGNICPGLELDASMKLTLILAFKERDPKQWALGYEAGSREVLSAVAKQAGLNMVCGKALSLYGPDGSVHQRLLKIAE